MIATLTARLQGHQQPVIAVAWHGISLVATASEEASVCVWRALPSSTNDNNPDNVNASSFTLLYTFKTASSCTALCFFNNTTLLATQDKFVCAYAITLTDNNTLHRFEYDIKEPLWQLLVSVDEINDMSLSSDRKHLFVGDDTGQLYTILLATRQIERRFYHAHTTVCSAVAFDLNDDRYGYSAGMDYRIISWDLVSGKPRFDLDIRTVLPSLKAEGGAVMYNPPVIMSMAIHRDALSQTFIAFGLGNGSVVVMQHQSQRQKKSKASKRVNHANKQDIHIHSDSVNTNHMTVSSMFTVNDKWDAVELMGVHRFFVSSVEFFSESTSNSKDTNMPSDASLSESASLRLVTGSADQTIAIWDITRAFNNDIITSPCAQCVLRAAFTVPVKINKIRVNPIDQSCIHLLVGGVAQSVTGINTTSGDILVYNISSTKSEKINFNMD